MDIFAQSPQNARIIFFIDRLPPLERIHDEPNRKLSGLYVCWYTYVYHLLALLD